MKTIEAVLYSEKYDQIVVVDPCPIENACKGVKTETDNELQLIIIESYLNQSGFNNLDNWIFLGFEVYETEAPNEP